MRSVSAKLALVTPKSAARAESGRSAISGRIRLALDATWPSPGMVRKSRSTAEAAALRAWGSSPVSTSTYFSPEPPSPTRVRTPGKVLKTSRMRASTTCLRGRWPRWVSCKVRVALRTSAAPCGAKGSPPALPPPMVVYTLVTSGMALSKARADSAEAKDWLSVLPGGSSRCTCVCELSSGGIKPLGRSGMSMTEPTKNAAAPTDVIHRWRMHHDEQRR